jgi:hypothetical protein
VNCVVERKVGCNLAAKRESVQPKGSQGEALAFGVFMVMHFMLWRSCNPLSSYSITTRSQECTASDCCTGRVISLKMRGVPWSAVLFGRSYDRRPLTYSCWILHYSLTPLCAVWRAMPPTPLQCRSSSVHATQQGCWKHSKAAPRRLCVHATHYNGPYDWQPEQRSCARRNLLLGAALGSISSLVSASPSYAVCR